jgi:Pyruvate/2-oxoacid:ferredoxin oxidoreductase delta subunit
VFAAGDCLPGGGTVAHAIGSGRRAADHLLAALGAVPLPPGVLAARGAAPDVAGPERIRPHWFGPALPGGRRRAGASERLRSGVEVRTGFTPEEARAEAARCMSCGSCTGCDVCFMLCPDRAVLRGTPGAYGVDRDRCKGCGVCAEECPRGAVDLIEAAAPVAPEGTRG